MGYSYFEIIETFKPNKCQRKNCYNDSIQHVQGFDICNECLDELTKIGILSKDEIKHFLFTRKEPQDKQDK